MPNTTDALAELLTGLEASPATRRFTDTELEAIYALAHGVYQQGHFIKAASYFSYLTLYRPTNVRFLKGLGASQFMQRAFAQAGATYAFLVMLNPEDAEALCLWGHSLLMSGDKDQARKALVRAAELTDAGAQVAVRAKALLALLAR